MPAVASKRPQSKQEQELKVSVSGQDPGGLDHDGIRALAQKKRLPEIVRQV
jgi:hypothetical protein